MWPAPVTIGASDLVLTQADLEWFLVSPVEFDDDSGWALTGLLRIEFTKPGDDSERLEMRFALRRTPVAKRFATLVDRGNAGPHEIRGSWSMGVDDGGLTDNVAEMNRLIAAFNDRNEGPGRLDGHLDADTVDADQLNRIHEQFEALLKGMHEGDGRVAGPDDLPDLLRAVNLTVHRLESDLLRVGSGDDVFGYFTTSLFQSGLPISEPLDRRDYRQFTMEEQFGILYANYATTGKNLQHIFWTDDLELLEHGGASPQRVITAGVLAMFNSRPKMHRSEYRRFARWFKENDIGRYGYRLSDKRNSLGMIKLGQLIPSPSNRRFYDAASQTFDPHGFVSAYAEHSEITTIQIEG